MIQPLISIRIHGVQRTFEPGEMVRGEYQIDGVDASDVQAVEASVLWHTEGKGDEDLGVHYFERLVPGNVPAGDLRAMRQLAVMLPNTPLTYDGVIVKVRWCLRVRAFLKRGRDVFFEQTFRLGHVPRSEKIEVAPSNETDGASDSVTGPQGQSADAKA